MGTDSSLKGSGSVSCSMRIAFAPLFTKLRASGKRSSGRPAVSMIAGKGSVSGCPMSPGGRSTGVRVNNMPIKKNLPLYFPPLLNMLIPFLCWDVAV